MLGCHTLQTWASTQPSVTLSSGEADFYGVVCAAGGALGQQGLLRDLACDLPVRVWTDSSAALGIRSRSGLGKLRHLETHTLRVQEKVRVKAFQLLKVRGEVNPADLSTKHLSSRERVEALIKLFGCEYKQGRAETAPQLRRQNQDPVQAAYFHEEAKKSYTRDEEEALDKIPMHDPAVLPHEYALKDIEAMFPKAHAPDEEIETEDQEGGFDWDLREPEIQVQLARQARRRR